MTRIVYFVFGILAYAVFFFTFLYAIGFVGNAVVPKSIDSGPVESTATALAVNLALLGAFAVQHSTMARRWFKERWTRVVPQPIERSLYVLVASLLLLLLFGMWRPMPRVIWSVSNPTASSALSAISYFGWALVLYGSFLIDHFDLFGLRQVYLHLRGRSYTRPAFVKPWLYQVVRNPLMLGFLIAFWFAPEMTLGHLLFAAATTGYIFIGVFLEERDLAHHLGEDYRRYRERTSMILPFPRFR
ncbi:MAG: hypothetical protein Q7R41_09345 [Phycisphaerales bacterium]|nr:hypothetical protein [Phycisphaerales bacterium]